MAITKKSQVSKAPSKKPAAKSAKITKPTASEKLATTTIIGRV